MRNICVVVASRANYGRVKSLMVALKQSRTLNLQVIVSASTLLYRFGEAVKVIKEDGFEPDMQCAYVVEGENLETQAKSTGLGIIELSSAFKQLRPDAVVTVADRFETMATAISATYMNIPLIHIQGGEVTGTIDESIRHAMSKFAHYHFAANEDACQRLIKLGELPEHVFDVGCPSIDALLNVEDDINVLEKFNLTSPFFLVLQHPVTTEFGKSESQILETIEAVNEFKDFDSLFILPNNDAGHAKIIEKVQLSGSKYVDVLGISDYVNLLKRSSGLIGNSSSGIHETPTFNIPILGLSILKRIDAKLEPNIELSIK